MCLSANGNLTADIGVVLVTLQERVATDENLAQPFEDVRVVGDLMLNEFLRDRE